jgi:hypothetical protein
MPLRASKIDETDPIPNSLKVRYEEALVLLGGPTPEQSILIH